MWCRRRSARQRGVARSAAPYGAVKYHVDRSRLRGGLCRGLSLHACKRRDSLRCSWSTDACKCSTQCNRLQFVGVNSQLQDVLRITRHANDRVVAYSHSVGKLPPATADNRKQWMGWDPQLPPATAQSRVWDSYVVDAVVSPSKKVLVVSAIASTRPAPCE